MISNIMSFIKAQCDTRLKKPFVSKDYTSDEKENLFAGMQIALENAKIQQTENINIEQIFAIFKAMKPDTQSNMKYAIRKGSVGFFTNSGSISQQGILETLNWLDDYQGGHGPRFELLDSNNKSIMYSPTIKELRAQNQCDSNIALATTLYSKLKDEKNKLLIISIFDSLNPLIDEKNLTPEQLKAFNAYEQRISQCKYKFYDVVKPTLQKLINEFNEQPQPSIDDIARFIKRMILLHPFVDGNGRTFALGVLNYLLFKYNYGLCFDLDPHNIPLLSVEELGNMIRDNLIPLEQFIQKEEIVVSQLNIQLEPKLIHLREAIKKMEDYGQRLLNGGSDKGQVAIDLAKELEEQVDMYRSKKNQTLIEYNEFKSAFSKTLHSQDAAFSEHRFYSTVVVKNIAIALTGIGLLFIVGKLVTSYCTTGQAVGFFSKTQRQENVQEIDKNLEKMTALTA